MPLVTSVIALVVLVLVGIYLGRFETGNAPRAATWLAVGVAIILVVLRAYIRRR